MSITRFHFCQDLVQTHPTYPDHRGAFEQDQPDRNSQQGAQGEPWVILREPGSLPHRQNHGPTLLLLFSGHRGGCAAMQLFLSGLQRNQRDSKSGKSHIWTVLDKLKKPKQNRKRNFYGNLGMWEVWRTPCDNGMWHWWSDCKSPVRILKIIEENIIFISLLRAN